MRCASERSKSEIQIEWLSAVSSVAKNWFRFRLYLHDGQRGRLSLL